MIIPKGFLTGDKERDFDIVTDLNHVTNIIWQSERDTFLDCELIAGQVITFLFEKGYIRGQK